MNVFHRQVLCPIVFLAAASALRISAAQDHAVESEGDARPPGSDSGPAAADPLEARPEVEVEAPAGADASEQGPIPPVQPAEETGDPEPVAQRRDPMLEARALELAGFRGLATLLLTSDPSGSEVIIGKDKTCITPCRVSLPPGRYEVTFSREDREEISVMAEVTSLEQIQVHAMLGQGTPWKLIVPAYFVGCIFAAGGISSLVVHGDTEPQPIDDSSDQLSADERRFHRNLGIASLAVGVPILVLATYLLLTGRPGEVRTSVAPGSEAISLAPIADPKSETVGLTVSGRF